MLAYSMTITLTGRVASPANVTDTVARYDGNAVAIV